jgi:hypothetical protein
MCVCISSVCINVRACVREVERQRNIASADLALGSIVFYSSISAGRREFSEKSERANNVS